MLYQGLGYASIGLMLKANAGQFGTRPAILGEGGISISHADLLRQVAATDFVLSRSGIRAGERVAIVMPPGPDLAVAFLSVATGATAAPLNPAYVEKEFEYYLKDLSVRTLLVERGSKSPARAAADKLGIPVLELTPLQEGGGISGSAVEEPSPAADAIFAPPDAVALVLHTSGTTSRPKQVPLSHANLCASAQHIGATFELQPTDISLSMMPLFHIHGLVCLLAALGAGGTCVCAGPLQTDKLSGWLETWKPTWLSAVPTMLQALLDFAQSKPTGKTSLRFIRSSSAALPPSVMTGLEKAFGVPVIESYGMTEAAHQMASNPLPPRARKAGSVGLSAGPQITILDEAGAQLKQGATGEVAIKGPNVMRGYVANAEATAKAFSDGWFRTGDQGYLDEDGYLFITGRLKELINRGGEKIAPREIDEALLVHPAVRQAVAFAVPHASLGEDIAAAVVLKPAAVITEEELRAFLLDAMPAFKVPSRIIFVDEVPKGPTGKIQRIGMADRLASFLSTAYEPPVTEMEQRIAATICAILGLKQVGRRDNFFALGGDSLRATQVLVRLEQALHLSLPVPLLFRLPTPALLSARLEELVASREVEQLASALAELSPEEQAALLDESERANPSISS